MFFKIECHDWLSESQIFNHLIHSREVAPLGVRIGVNTYVCSCEVLPTCFVGYTTQEVNPVVQSHLMGQLLHALQVRSTSYEYELGVFGIGICVVANSMHQMVAAVLPAHLAKVHDKV